MAIKLFNRKQEMSDPYAILDKLMSEMASDKTYIEYLRLRESVQLEIFLFILIVLFLFGVLSANGIGEGDSKHTHEDKGENFNDYRL